MRTKLVLIGAAGVILLGAAIAFKPVRQRLLNGDLETAIRKRDVSAAAMLFQEGGRPLSPQRRDELLFLAANSNPTLLQGLLHEGADPDAVDPDGNTLLDAAQRYDCARKVLHAGADREKRSRAGDTPLHHAIRCGDYIKATMLLEASASARAMTREGGSPLHLLVSGPTGPHSATAVGLTPPVPEEMEHPRSFVLGDLVKQGADPSARDRSGETPLHLAVRAGEIEMVRLLLNEGADPNARDRAGQAPGDELLPSQRNSLEAKELLALLKHPPAINPLTPRVVEEARR